MKVKDLFEETVTAKIKNEIKKAVKQAYDMVVEEEIVEVFQPKDLSFGDYTTNIGFKLAPILKTSPVSITAKLVNLIKGKIFSKVNPIGGYINFYLSENIILDEVKKNAFSKTLFSEKNERLLVEFGQPNTHKDPHIGHLFSYVLGESLARLLETAGYKVYRVNYQGDVGLHVAKCLWGVFKNRQEFEELQAKKGNTFEDLKEKTTFLQKCYVEGNRDYEENEEAKRKIYELLKAIYSKQGEVYEVWKVTRNWSVEFYKEFERVLGIKYHKNYFESEVASEGERIVKENIGKVFVESEGAIVFKGEDYGLHTRVFITSEGYPTYEGKEIGLVSLKIKDFDPDFLIVATAKEQVEYFKVVTEAADKIFPGFKKKFKHVAFGMVNLKTGKISSRKGNIITAVELYERVKEEIIKTYDVDDDTASKVTLAAIKYSFLNPEADKDMLFDIEESIAKEGNSGPYLLYSLVRAKSVLKKAGGFSLEDESIFEGLKKMRDEEVLLFRKLLHFKEAIISSLEYFSPHVLTNFLFNISQLYNHIYQKYSVLKAEEGLKKARLFLTQAYASILNKGLFLLGIESVERL